MNNQFNIHPNIAEAETLPAQFYKSEKIFQLIKEKVFLKSWQWVGSKDLVPFEGYAHPFILLEGYLTEPLAVVRTKDNEIICLSNVCTHRGNIVVQQSGKTRNLSCMYHGRRFNLSGEFEFMPEFTKTKNFPRPCDDLHRFKMAGWGPFLFAGLAPSFELKNVIDKINERVGFLPLNEFKEDRLLSREYLVHAHWALYCDNYLEGFHIPLVHPKLNTVINYKSYKTEIFDDFSMQWCFLNPDSSPYKNSEDNNKAFYFTIYPNILFNIAPGRLQTNTIEPIDEQNCNVIFDYYFKDVSEKKIKEDIVFSEEVQNEDIYICEKVQKGLKSNGFNQGIFSEKYEIGVSHFQSYISEKINNG